MRNKNRGNNLEEKILEHFLSSNFNRASTIRAVDIAEIFDVGIMPVREALGSLEEKGFVERRKKKGTFLKPVSFKEVNDLYDLRSVLEGLAARLLCGVVTASTIDKLKELDEEYRENEPGRIRRVLAGIDYRFHLTIVESCKNERLVSLVKDFHLLAKTFKSSAGGEFVRKFQNPYTHSNIIEAIEKMDFEEAERVARMHVESIKEYTIKGMLAEGVDEMRMG